MKAARTLYGRFIALFEDPADDEPAYDPVHLGVVSVASLVVIGLLYWLLWTLLVYEGGIFSKAAALFSSTRDADAFEGWIGNVAALLIAAALVTALHRLYWSAAKSHARRSSH